jgi:hypothetical protein
MKKRSRPVQLRKEGDAAGVSFLVTRVSAFCSQMDFGVSRGSAYQKFGCDLIALIELGPSLMTVSAT